MDDTETVGNITTKGNEACRDISFPFLVPDGNDWEIYEDSAIFGGKLVALEKQIQRRLDFAEKVVHRNPTIRYLKIAQYIRNNQVFSDWTGHWGKVELNLNFRHRLYAGGGVLVEKSCGGRKGDEYQKRELTRQCASLIAWRVQQNAGLLDKRGLSRQVG